MHGSSNHSGSRPKRAFRIVGTMVFALFLLMLTIAGALALSVDAPLSVQEGSTLQVSATGQGAIEIFLNGIAVASGTSSVHYTLETNSSSAGLYAFTFAGPEGNITRTIEVENVPLDVLILAPEKSEMADTSVRFAVQTNWPPELCYVNIDGQSNTLDRQSDTMFEKILPVTEGIHTVQYKCKMDSELPSVERTLLIDTTAPVIAVAGPRGEQAGPHITLSITTDEIAQCRYGQSDVPFDKMQQSMGSTYALRNTANIVLDEPGSYTYFVRCKDVHQNVMERSQVISFLNRIAPSAEIRLVGAEEPLRAGTYELELETNVPLTEAPSLAYTIQESTKRYTIGLTGDQTDWEGFLTIPTDVEGSILLFSFEGKSVDGISGTQITKGSVLKIDATPPPEIEAISLDNSSGHIRISWFVKDPEEDMTYNIYRKSKEGVTYADYYTTTGSMSYADKNAYDARYYYYRIAAVDKAGNIGPLSEEVWGTRIDSILANNTLDPMLEAKIDEEMLMLKALIIDANATIDEMNAEPSPEKSRIIRNMDLIGWAREARVSLMAEQEALLQLKREAASAERIEMALTNARAVRDHAREKIIRRIYSISSTEVNQQSDREQLERNIPYALASKELSDGLHEQYVQDAIRLQDRITVSLEAESFTLWNLAGQQKDYTFVRKSVSLDNPANDIGLIEIIPESVVDASKITFENKPAVLADHVIQYEFPVIEHESFSYVIDHEVSMQDIRRTRTFLYPEPPAVQEKPGIVATGFSIAEFDMPDSEMMLIIAAMLVVLGLVIYYVSISREQMPFHGVRFHAGPAPARMGLQAQHIVRNPLPRQELSPSQRLEMAHEAIDDKRYEQALKLYKPLLATDADSESISVLYRKLLLYKRLDDAGRAIEQKQVKDARKALEEARSLACHLGEQNTKLIREAKEAFERFVRDLNRIEIQRNEAY